MSDEADRLLEARDEELRLSDEKIVNLSRALSASQARIAVLEGALRTVRDWADGEETCLGNARLWGDIANFIDPILSPASPSDVVGVPREDLRIALGYSVKERPDIAPTANEVEAARSNLRALLEGK
jgi:hypothetical protein